MIKISSMQINNSCSLPFARVSYMTLYPCIIPLVWVGGGGCHETCSDWELRAAQRISSGGLLGTIIKKKLKRK